MGHHGGFEGNYYQRYCHETDQNPLGVTPDVTDVFGTIDVTPVDDEPPDDILNVPRDQTADISPQQPEVKLIRRARNMADMIRPKSKMSPSAEESSINNAGADAMGQHRDNHGDYEEHTI
jgi:hypothetical protein